MTLAPPPASASVPLRIVVDLTSPIFRGLEQQRTVVVLGDTSSCPPAEAYAVNQREGRAAGSTRASLGDRDGVSLDIVEEWGLQSFPASDPPANW